MHILNLIDIDIFPKSRYLFHMVFPKASFRIFSFFLSDIMYYENDRLSIVFLFVCFLSIYHELDVTFLLGQLGSDNT